MAYIGAQEVKQIRNELRARFPNFSFDCRKSYGSLGIEVTIKQGPIDFFKDYNGSFPGRPSCTSNTYVYNTQPQVVTHGVTAPCGGLEFFSSSSPAKDNMQAIHYLDLEHFSGDAKNTLSEVLEVIKTASDRIPRVGCFDTPTFYIHLNVGTWKTPYHVVH